MNDYKKRNSLAIRGIISNPFPIMDFFPITTFPRSGLLLTYPITQYPASLFLLHIGTSTKPQNISQAYAF